ncbi:MAG TPA: uroporphyrinogen decarboxylase family protein [Oceanipulchritudo sp.]|nr:uroporphyrinogen decarboxylase family protein [Oceanipulchritudo sp.]
MNPRQRVLNTINRQPVDRTPVDLWMTPEIMALLKQHTGVDDDLETFHKLGLDKIVWLSPNYKDAATDLPPGEERDPWGVVSKEIKSGKATYFEVSGPPLAEMEDPEELEEYPHWPDPDLYDYAALRRKAERARQFEFATMGPWVSHFEVYCRMRGLENALMDVLSEPEFLQAALDRIEAVQTAVLQRIFAELGHLVDMVLVSDDLGTQESQLISTAHWSQFLKPRLSRWCQLIHSHGKKVFYHTDGAARPFIPGLIECGVDILNPIQHICPGMDRASLKAAFGNQLIFHGAIENQHVIPHGTPDEVRREVIACLETLGAGGGYIPCSCHNVQAGTPLENVLTLIETVREWRPA